MNPVVLAVVGGYLVLCLLAGVAARGRSSDSAAGYVAGDRSLGTLVMYFITGATIFSAFAFLGAPGRAYERGAAAFAILAFGTIGFVPFYFVGPRAARVGRALGFVTQAEMVAARFGRRSLAGLMALVSVLAFVPYLMLQMKGAGYVVSAVTAGEVPAHVGSAVVYGVVLTYVLASGVLGVGWTNTLQGVFMMILAWTLGLWVPHALYGGLRPMFDAVIATDPELLRVPGRGPGGAEPWLLSEYSSDILVSAIGFSFWPHMFMKAFSARSDATLRRTVVLYPTFQLFLVPLLIVGFCGVAWDGPAPEQADQILPHLLLSLELPSFVVGLFCAGALAASMSSGDAIAHAAASIAVRDGVVTAGGRKLSAHAERAAIRVAVVVVVVLAYALSLSNDQSLVGLLFLAYGPVTQLVPGVVAALYSRRATGAGVLAGLAVGIAVNVYFAVNGEARPFPVHAGAYGLVANVVALVAVSLATRPTAEDPAERRFLAVAAGSEAPGSAAREPGGE